MGFRFCLDQKVTMEFPPNSRAAQEKEDKKIEQVTSVPATKRRKPLGRQFRDTFIGGDARSTAQFVFFDVFMPAAKDMLVDIGSQGIERLVFGESRNQKRRPSPGPSLGHIAYNQMTQGQQQRPPQLSRRARSNHDFGEIVIASRREAEDVLDSLFTLVGQYDSATIADLYELVGLASSHTDYKWGWRDMQGSSVMRVRSGGYLLSLPEPEHLG